MPVVLRRHGFTVVIYTHDHTDRAHVHVRYGDAVVVINLATPTRPQMVRAVRRMKRSAVRAAFGLIAEHTEQLLEDWRRIHGEAGTS